MAGISFMSTQRNTVLAMAGAVLFVTPMLRADVRPLAHAEYIYGQTVNFDQLEVGWVTDTAVLASQGIQFGSTEGLGVVPGMYMGMQGNSLWDRDGGLVIQLHQPSNAVGFTFSHLPSSPDLVLRAYGVNGLIGTVTSSGASGYLGVMSFDDAITMVSVQTRGLIPGSGAGSASGGAVRGGGLSWDAMDRVAGIRGGDLPFSLDNFSFGNATVAPAPGALILALGGLGCVALIRRRFGAAPSH